jgi:ribonuclease HI
MSYIAYFDGACEPINPGGTATYGAIILKNSRRIWQCSKIYYPPAGHETATSNNVAEYSGLIAVLSWFTDRELYDAEILVRGDSKLVIEQMFGAWRIKKGLYVSLAHQARTLLKPFTNIEGQWVPRRKNTIADWLSKTALRRAKS